MSKNPRKRYFPNNLQQVMAIKVEDLQPVPFEKVMERTLMWDLHPQIVALCRVTNRKTGNVTELAFACPITCNRLMSRLMKSGEYRVDTLTQEEFATGYNYEPPEHLKEDYK